MNKIIAMMAGLIVFIADPLLAGDSVTARFSGKVADETGLPLAGVNVLINRVSGAPIDSDITPLKTVTGTNGEFELPLRLHPTKPAEIKCELRFEHPGFLRAEAALQFPSNTNVTRVVNPVLRPGEILSGVIRAHLPASGRGDGASVFSITSGDWEGVFATGKDGAFEIYVPPGECRFSVLSGEPFEIGGVKSGATNLVIEPKPFVWSEESTSKVFDDFWREMDLRYSYFFLKTNVDWRALRDEYRPPAIRAKNPGELAKVLQQMLTPLCDLHVWIETPDGVLGTYSSSYTFNGNGKVTRQAIEATAQCGKFAVVGKTKRDGFGYFLILRQSNATAGLVQQAVAAIEKLRDAPGFIVDLRGANGGSEPFAQEIARLFCVTNTVYAKQKYRNGPGHNDLGNESERVLKAVENPLAKPVVCIIGPGTVSSGEGFVKMMKALPHVTTVGMPTRGASGNPKPFRLGNTGVTVTFSRWVDLLPHGETFEGRGIPPDVMVDEPPSAYAELDPTLERALALLREKILKAKNARN